MHSSLTRFPIQGLCLNLLNSHGADLVGQQGGEGVQAHGAQILAAVEGKFRFVIFGKLPVIVNSRQRYFQKRKPVYQTERLIL